MKIKLKDMTYEQFEKWKQNKCEYCENCFFNNVPCNSFKCWVNHKDLYSDKFLNQEIEIPQEPTLTEKEKDYLLNVIRPFYSRVKWIEKINAMSDNNQKIMICIDDETSVIVLPSFEKSTMYNGLMAYVKYTLEELGL